MPTVSAFWAKKIFWGIRRWELAAFVSFHVFLAALYFLTLLLTVNQWQVTGILVNYSLKLVITAPLWYLFFRKLRHWPLYSKLLLHIPCCVGYIALWLGLFYSIVDLFAIGRLQGAGIWWDVYIPVLIYLMQFGIFHAYDYWCQTVLQKEKEKSLLRLAHSAELATLKAQIQPHFLFNTLNSISASVPAAQEHTRTLIVQLADVFRFAMNVSAKERIPLGAEMAFLRNFLALEQQRFGDRLAIEIVFDESLSDYPVPPMLLQPLVENAVKHGIARSVAGGAIRVRAELRGSEVEFEVTDTGNGINGYEPASLFTKGIGLENTRQRLRKMYGTELQVAAAQPQGFRVQFSLPLQPAHD